jgi:hypothetical protein
MDPRPIDDSLIAELSSGLWDEPNDILDKLIKITKVETRVCGKLRRFVPF